MNLKGHFLLVHFDYFPQSLYGMSNEHGVYRDLVKALRLGGARLNLPEFAWLMNCSVVSDHSSFKFLKALLSGDLHAVGAGELTLSLVEQECSNVSMATHNFQCVRHSLASSDNCKPNLVGSGEKVSILTFSDC